MLMLADVIATHHLLLQ